MTALLVAGAGALGVLARYGVGLVAAGAGATLAINVAGSFLLGLLIASGTSEQTRAALGVGFLGGFTTYSTFALQAWSKVEDGATAGAALLVVASVVLGVGAAGLGVAVGRG